MDLDYFGFGFCFSDGFLMYFGFCLFGIYTMIVAKIGKSIDFFRKKQNVLYLRRWHSEPKTNKKLELSFVFVN